MSLSFQLYSARSNQPWSPIFGMLASLGYTQVEGYGALYDDPAALAADLETHGLTMPSAHIGLSSLEGDPAGSVALARTLGIETVIVPFLEEGERPTDRAGWKALAIRLTTIGTRLAGAGLGFGWHNHDFELRPCADGAVPLEVILDEAPMIGWEADLAWVVRGQADPLAWVRRYGERIVAVHLKDIAPGGECLDEDGWADLGHGTMDWPSLIDALGRLPNEPFWIVEHDKPSDVERFARRSKDYIESQWRATR